MRVGHALETLGGRGVEKVRLWTHIGMLRQIYKNVSSCCSDYDVATPAAVRSVFDARRELIKFLL